MDYITILGIGFPGVQVECFGDPFVYGNLVWVRGQPMPSKATLDAWAGINGEDTFFSLNTVHSGTIGARSGTTRHDTSSPPAIDTGTSLVQTTIIPTSDNSLFQLTCNVVADVSSNNRAVTLVLYINGEYKNAVVQWIRDSSRPITLTLMDNFVSTSFDPIDVEIRTGIDGGSGTWYISTSNHNSRNFNNQTAGVWTIVEHT